MIDAGLLGMDWERDQGGAVLEAIAGVRVGCVGDLMLDRFVIGQVERISPEAPVPVLRVADEDAMLGGAGNVVRNLAALGARVSLAAAVGDDAAGRQVRELLAAMPVVAADVLVDPTRPTSEKTRFLAANQQLLRTDRETTAALPPALRDELIAHAEAWGPSCAALILSDYGKGTLAAGVCERLIAQARQQAMPVVVDPKGADYGRYRGATVVTPNRRELAEALGRPIARGEEADAARRLAADQGLAAVLVTLGAEGMLLVAGDAPPLPVAATARAVFDVCGAGDTVAATLAAALAAGVDLAEAAHLANIAAGIVVGKVGSAVAGVEEIAQALHREDVLASEAKLMTAMAAREQAARWRRQGLRVGFTNGCFDLLHPGHLSLLRQARAACDRLIVGLNADASVARLKGPGRPVQPEAARALVLASLAGIDAVVAFAEDTPLRLIETLHPDVLVKGADYRLADVVGAELVQGWGGRVLLARLEPGFSTSATVARLGQ